jgi:CheY-like chemotaxis protein
MKRFESSLEHSHRVDAIGQVASGIAHDVNNMLSVILSHCAFASDALAPGDPARADIDEIASVVTRTAALTAQLLAFARHQPVDIRTVDVNQVMAKMERMLRRVIEVNIRMTSILAANPATVSADASWIEQIAMNLALNARDSMPTGGRLVVETSNVEIDEETARAHPGATPGPHVLLTVSDTGTGMDDDTMARIFDPFFTTKAPGEGTGIGLSTVHDIVRRAGGTIAVRSEPGKGTSFAVSFPCVFDATPPASTVRRPLETLRGTETILVVEPEPQLLRLITVALHRHGYDVLSTTSAGEALLIAEQHSGAIDLLLTDVVLPLLGGGALAERLRRARPTLKVALMSGYGANAFVEPGAVSPGSSAISKPFSTSALLQWVRAILDASAD